MFEFNVLFLSVGSYASKTTAGVVYYNAEVVLNGKLIRVSLLSKEQHDALKDVKEVRGIAKFDIGAYESNPKLILTSFTASK